MTQSCVERIVAKGSIIRSTSLYHTPVKTDAEREERARARRERTPDMLKNRVLMQPYFCHSISTRSMEASR